MICCFNSLKRYNMVIYSDHIVIVFKCAQRVNLRILLLQLYTVALVFSHGARTFSHSLLGRSELNATMMMIGFLSLHVTCI